MARRKIESTGGISILPSDADNDNAGDSVNTIGGIEIINPPTDDTAGDTAGDTANGTDAPSGDAPKRRGRKPGSKNSVTGTRDSKTEVDLIDGGLIVLHTLASSVLAMPELLISQDQRKSLAGALQKVNALYDPKVSKEVVAWVNLAFVAGTIYVPIAIDIKRRMDAESKESTTQESFGFPQVMQFPA